MVYKHGIEVFEKATSFPSPISTRYGVQVIFGTAPVNLAAEPYGTANRPIKAAMFDEAEKMLGYSDDWESYSLCQSMYACFKVFQASPVIFVNVLDPVRHSKELVETIYTVKNHQAVLGVTGILPDTVIISAQRDTVRIGTAKTGRAVTEADEYQLKKDTDYIMDYADDGCLIITLLSTGSAYQATEISATAKVIAPELVTEEDMIGYYNIETGEETGMEVLRQVYPKYGLVPGALLAPGWTERPNIGAALQGKCKDISGVFRSLCLLDLDTEKARKYMDCLALKEAMGYDEEHSIVLWPKLSKDGKVYNYSAVYGAMMSYYTAVNNDVPYIYPSNKTLNVDGAVLSDGTEILLDQVQAGNLNGDGIVTAINDNVWKSYGNNTGCYPTITDPKDRWIGCRRMFDYVANYFVMEYKKRLDENMDRRTVDDIVNSFNIWGNSLMAAGMCAGLKMEFREEENTTEDILSGRIKVRIYLSPYTPVEYIQATEEFDLMALKTVLSAE